MARRRRLGPPHLIPIFTDIFLYAVIVPVIPFALRARIGVPEEDVQHWVSVLISVYGAALLVGSPVCGFLADRMTNRKLPLILGLLALAGATLLLCLGKTIGILLAGRVLQGISAAVVWTVGLALLADTVPPESVGQALGYVGISMSLGILVAPLLGGIVYANVGYYPVYFLAFGMIFLDIILRFMLLEKKPARTWLREQTAAIREEQQEEKPDSTNPAATNEESIPTIEPSLSNSSSQQHVNPFKALGILLSSRRLLAALVCTLFQSVLLTSWDATIPIYVNRIFGWSSLGAGLVFLPLILPTFMAPLVGRWADKKGPRWPTVTGFLFAVPFLVLLRLVDHNSIRQKVLLCALLALTGLAITNALTPLEAEIVYIVRHKELTHPRAFGGRGAYATAYGLWNMAFAGGMLIGPLWGGFITQGAGWGTMSWSLAILSAAGAGIAWLFIGGEVWKKTPPESGHEQNEQSITEQGV
ncbi:uncharacterized protein KY384_001409 [Bacidia gigantensis]|uniref:uncharacterized protein n=1 Tax=Bacidia gigantensis TaxID=2732470 RepID=UPI001D0394DB|nr:uncharacterized protein KY384_001409 [Bacidia gigantensis]KAG8533668.1 hypothetical protein KY384_001409 [Bacidia gigantensis]